MPTRCLPSQQQFQVKPGLLDTLRQSQQWDARDAKVDIFLHEGLIDDAIAAVNSDTYHRSEQVHRVMQVAESLRPEWVIEAGRRRAEPIMKQGKANRYDCVVEWLQHVKAAYLHLDQAAKWNIYFRGLQSTHARKYKLMNLLNQLR